MEKINDVVLAWLPDWTTHRQVHSFSLMIPVSEYRGPGPSPRQPQRPYPLHPSYGVPDFRAEIWERSQPCRLKARGTTDAVFRGSC